MHRTFAYSLRFITALPRPASAGNRLFLYSLCACSHRRLRYVPAGPASLNTPAIPLPAPQFLAYGDVTAVGFGPGILPWPDVLEESEEGVCKLTFKHRHLEKYARCGDGFGNIGGCTRAQVFSRYTRHTVGILDVVLDCRCCQF